MRSGLRHCTSMISTYGRGETVASGGGSGQYGYGQQLEFLPSPPKQMAWERWAGCSSKSRILPTVAYSLRSTQLHRARKHCTSQFRISLTEAAAIEWLHPSGDIDGIAVFGANYNSDFWEAQ